MRRGGHENETVTRVGYLWQSSANPTGHCNPRADPHLNRVLRNPKASPRWKPTLSKVISSEDTQDRQQRGAHPSHGRPDFSE